MRSKQDLQPLCQAETAEYILIALYALTGVIMVWQLCRMAPATLVCCKDTKELRRRSRVNGLEGATTETLAREKQKRKAFLTTHALLLLVCLLRIVYLGLRPSLEPMPPLLVLLALLPSFIQISIFM